jgi:hypothetical protein
MSVSATLCAEFDPTMEAHMSWKIGWMGAQGEMREYEVEEREHAVVIAEVLASRGHPTQVVDTETEMIVFGNESGGPA